MIDSFVQTDDPDGEPVVDRRVLSALLNMAGDEVRAALLSQLQLDLLRLDMAFTACDAETICRAAHEAKGLASTIGAGRLARLAQSLNALGPRLGEGGVAAMAAPVRHEVAAVLAELRMSAGK